MSNLDAGKSQRMQCMNFKAINLVGLGILLVSGRRSGVALLRLHGQPTLLRAGEASARMGCRAQRTDGASVCRWFGGECRR